MKPYLSKLVEKGDLSLFKGAYFQARRLRGIKPKQEKPAPIPEKKILSTIEANPGLTLSELADKMGEKTYHRLIKQIDRLKKRGLVTITAGKYALADS